MKFLVSGIKEVGYGYLIPKKGGRAMLNVRNETLATNIVTDVVELAPSVYLFRTMSGSHYIVKVLPFPEEIPMQ